MIGKTIGSYTILSQLGVGAMGEVYLAEHRHLKRKAAVKLLAPEIVGRPDLLERFFLEARATSAIDHPGIVQVFDCEVDATGRPYIVMEYLGGETLAATLARRGALPAATVARLGRGMAEALEAAHAKGIVHRDIKPENIFVQAQPPDSVKLVDFGIAKLAGDFRAGQVHQTRSGAMMGTPLYMSPEQCRDSGKIDFRTDLYSLGCVMFEMSTGHPPFTHEALGDLVVAHLTEQPKDVRAVTPAVPKPLADLIAELLRKDPAQRPPNMRAVADRLAAFIGGLTTVPEAAPSSAPKPEATKKKTTFGDAASELMSESDDLATSARRAPVLFGLGALAVVLVGGALVYQRSHMSDAVPAIAAAASNPPTTSATAPPPSSAAAAAGGKGIEATGTKAAEAASAKAAGGSGASKAAPVSATPQQKEEPHAKRPPGHRVAEAASERHGRSSAAGAAGPSAPTPATGGLEPPLDFSGVWEGPWTDGARHQNGRLYLQVSGDGAATGWLSNATVNQSFRLNGRMGTPGDLALACECPPRQEFGARVVVHAVAGGELKGQLSLTGNTGVFGQSHLVLRRAPAR